MALFASAAALWLRHTLTPLFGTQYPFLLSTVVIFFSVWYCGIGPAILASLASTLGIWYLFLPATNSFALENPRAEVAGLLSFVVTCSLVIALGAAQRRSRTRLEEEVRDRLRVEAALRDAERDLQEAQRLARIGSWKWDAASDTVTWTRELYRIAGRDPSLPAPSYAEMPSRYTPESWQRVKAAVERALSSGEGYELELEMVRPDGSQIMVITHAEALRDAAGKVVGLMGSLQDITERKRAEEALRLATERFQVALKGAHIAVFNHDLDLRCTWVYNPDLGYDPALVIGRTDLELAERAEDAEVTMQIKREVIRSGVGRRQEIQFRQRGEDRWYQLVVEPLRNSEGGIAGVTCATIDITERKEAEEALRSSEERLRFIAERAEVGIWDWDLLTGRLDGSPLCRTIFGVAETEEFSYTKFLAVLHPADRELTAQAIRLCLEGGGRIGYDQEYRAIRPDGSIRWIQARGSASFEDGRPVRMAGIVLDITERKQAEDALRASEERLRFIAERASAGFWDWDLITGRLEWSLLCKQLFGIPPGETMSYERFLESVHPEDRELTDRINRAYLESGGGPEYEHEYRVIWPNGTVRWIHAKGSATFEHGRALRMAGIVLDVTDRRHHEEALRTNEQRLRMAYQAAHSGAWEVDLRTREIMWSPEMQGLWGLVPGSVTVAETRAQISRMLHPEDQPIVDQALVDALAGKGYHLVFRIHRADGALRWMESFGEVIYDAGKIPQRIVGVAIDITERRQAEEELRKSHLELERKVEERTKALADSLASLELEVEVRKQTEAALQGLSARLLRLQDEERRRVARDLHDSTGQTLAALKMTIASLESLAGQIPQARQIIRDLNALTEDALRDIRTTSHLLHPPLLDEVGFTSAARWYLDELAKRSGIKTRLELTLAAGRLTKSSELAFFRVLQEGLTNVIRHSGSTAVEVSLHGNHENATLTIKDFGKGIPQATLNAFRETGAGVGVGLGGMKQRIRELGGQLEIASDGTGTSIMAILPTADIEPAAPRGDGTGGEPVGPFKSTRLL